MNAVEAFSGPTRYTRSRFQVSVVRSGSTITVTWAVVLPTALVAVSV